MTKTSMQTAEAKQRATEIICTEVANAVVEFMVDCGMNGDQVNVGNLCFAFEYAYRPLPRFWRDFDLKAVLEAITRQFPDWRATAVVRQQSVSDVLSEVEGVLATYAFDEANAEMMMALPLAARPRDREAASEWIFSELRKRNLQRELRYAQRDGNRCGEGALETLHCVERAALGIVYERLGTQVARSIRNCRLAGD
ncbi:hypothetical protein B0G80_5419 [Paraburkholderia sp. BL6669N2]|uniref:hypothetical protein n=1 Tax=Paraburkholderia sp. BL6669N2 TaxID=1938807 RepID=UPI000E37DCC0|nr:hypothetical protein [Paraburkholderia sp. BL6669N2]REG49089.1 hypothetical protein B0G80_5419 [Paraburkholderia sp. BL6669N2]